METKRIKTNIIELSRLKKDLLLDEWLKEFKDGKLDAHLFYLQYYRKYPFFYEWLYENTDYDLAGWQIENGYFDWENDSWVVARYCQENFDAEKFNWKRYSNYVTEHCPEKIDPERYNWENFSYCVAQYAPDKIDADKYNWFKDSWAIAKYCPEKLDPNKYNWKDFTKQVKIYCPEKLILKPQELL